MSVPTHATGPLIDLAQSAPPVALDELAPPGGLLLIIPHPDDETLGCGAALAEAARAGRDLSLVLTTDGEASHPCSHSHDAERLRSLRRAELDTALGALAPDCRVDIVPLSLPDGRCEPAHLTGSLVAKLVDLARRREVRAVWTTWRHDPHCDHQVAARLAAAITQATGARLWEFPVWGRFNASLRPTPLLRRFVPRDASAILRKTRAMDAYRSQLTPLIADDPTAFTMPPAIVEHFAAHPELFVRG